MAPGVCFFFLLLIFSLFPKSLNALSLLLLLLLLLFLGVHLFLLDFFGFLDNIFAGFTAYKVCNSVPSVLGSSWVLYDSL